MRSLDSSSSSAMVSTNSWALRTRVRSPERNRFLANCWVMVEPPTTLGGLAALPLGGAGWASAFFSALAFFCQAFSIASQFTPSWSAKASSSEAMTARLSCGEIALEGTHCWRQGRLPLAWAICQACERSKLVDSGAHSAHRAMRAMKNNSSSSSASAQHASQRMRAVIGLPKRWPARFRPG